MSGRLVGEVVEWLRSPAAEGLTIAERLVLMTIAERANEADRHMWRHRGDGVTLFEFIRQVTGMDAASLKKVFQKLRSRGLEVRIPLSLGKDGRPIFSHRGAATQFRLPHLPPSTALPDRGDEHPPFPPVDNPSGGSPEQLGRRDEDPPNSPKGGATIPPNGPKGGTRVPPYPSKEDPSKEHPSTPGVPTYGAEEEDAHPATATPPAGTSPHMGWEPAYIDARDYLFALPNEGAEYMAAAATALGPDAPVADRVIYAAQCAKEGIPA